ncbi:energy transducer TonB [Sphingomonas sp.]|uniref:energy transducer TonB n=1 Tax=Sphingomonas sp. TaxID=28214 RepID=UPI0031D598D7
MRSRSAWGMAIMLCALLESGAFAQKGNRAGDDTSAFLPRGNIAALFGPDTYPPEAMRAGEQGRVVAKLSVDATGTVTNCTIIESVSPSLDAATCRAVQTGKPIFRQVRDRRGKAVAFQYTLPVRWNLPDREPMVASATRFDITVEGDGTVSRCEAAILPSGTMPAEGRTQTCAAAAQGMSVGVAQRNGGTPQRFRVLMLKDTSFGDMPPLTGAWPQDMQKLHFWQTDFDVDPAGYAVNCTILQQVGFVDVDVAPTPCRLRRRFDVGTSASPKGHEMERIGYQILPPSK